MADTIAAIATAPGMGAVGVVKLAGPDTEAIADALGLPCQPRLAKLCTIKDANSNPIDSGLVLYFPAPHSYTGDSTLEFHGHGGPVVLDQVLKRFIQCGARIARPGEFSERAFLNDKLDLAQAEAVADLISASSAQAAQRAMQSLQGEFSQAVNTLHDDIVRLRVYVEAAIDFPEEEIDFLAHGQVSQQLLAIEQDLEELRKNARAGQRYNEGIQIVLVGKPNAGKSSLLNALSGQDSAIVTDQAGTTRDVLKERIVLGGIPCEILDTAGLRETLDPIEAEGVKRAKKAMQTADLILFLADPTESSDQLTQDLSELLDGKVPDLVLFNKTDLCPAFEFPNSLSISAKTGAGLDELIQTIVHTTGADQGEAKFLARTRHLDALAQCQNALTQARIQLDTANAGELLAEDLRYAHEHLGDITGRMTADDLLGEIFSSFCIGK